MRKFGLTVAVLALAGLAGCSSHQDLLAPDLLEKDTHAVNSQLDVPPDADTRKPEKK